MPQSRPWLLVVAALTAAGLWGVPAAAQVNSDIGISGGVMKRITTGAEDGTPAFGPVVQLQAHLAVLPMLRVGLYASWDYAAMPSYGSRNVYEGGIHAKLTPPLLSAPWKTYLYAGLGGGYVRQEGFQGLGGVEADMRTIPVVTYSANDGAIMEIPVGLGLAYQLGSAPGGRGRHWDLFFELGGRFGIAFFGSIYDPNGTATATEANLPNGQTVIHGPFLGQDSFALTLSVGVSWSN